jgi:hypothetical protein
LVLLKLPSLDEYFPQKFGAISTTMAIGVGLCVLTILNHWFTTVSPYKKYEKWAGKRWQFFEAECNKIIQQYKKEADIDVKMNIMLAKRWWVNNIAPSGKAFPKSKWRLFQLVLYSIWGSSNNGKVDHRLFFTVNQGACGNAYKSGKPFFRDLSVGGTTSDLNERQQTLTKGLQFVASVPIFAEDNSPDEHQKKVIGTLNFETSSTDAGAVLSDQIIWNSLSAQLSAASNVIAKYL